MHADHRLTAQIIGDDSSITWKEALDRYRFPVDLTTFTDAADYPGWFDLTLDPGDPIQTMDFETRFREQARHHLEVWGEVVFWKNYTMPLGRTKLTRQVLGKSSVRPAELWSSCLEYVANPNLESFKAFRSKLFGDSIATAATFPAFIRPDQFPMVDTQITKWAVVNGELHSYARIGGPNLVSAPVLAAGVLKGIHWPFVESWMTWCRFTAWKLSQLTGQTWRARDVEMAVFTAQRIGLTLTPLT